MGRMILGEPKIDKNMILKFKKKNVFRIIGIIRLISSYDQTMYSAWQRRRLKTK
jgi:hypothetical protein